MIGTTQLINAFGGPASTTDDVDYPVTNLACYKFDNNSKDSGKSRGKFNQGATFVGSSAGIVNTTLQLSSTAHSVSLWMKPQDLTATKWQIMFFSAFNGHPTFTLGKRPDKTTSFHYRNESSNEVYFTLSTADTWYHVVVTRNSSGSTVYVNGSSVATDSNSMGTYSSSAYEKATIGSNPNYPAEYFDGTVDQVRVYNVALTATDVANLYNNETTTTADTLSFPTGKTAIATYKLDGDGVDISGNHTGSEDNNVRYAYDGTDTDIQYRAGQFGQAAVFDGSTSFIDTNYTLTTDTTFSFSWWMNADSPTTNHYIFNDGNGTGHDGTFAIYHNTSGQLGMWIGANGSGYAYGTLTITGGLSGSWMHFVVSIDGSTATVYKNGSLAGTISVTSHSTAGILTLIIGRLGHYSGYHFKGKIDQLRILPSALTSSQVTQLYNEIPETDTSNFKAVLFQSNNAVAQSISNVGFQPDLIIGKTRQDAASWDVYDSVRGGNKYLGMNLTNVEATGSYVSSFDTNGFSLGTASNFNYYNDRQSVAYCWKGGGTAVSNGNGSITSSVSANPTAGFSIVKWTGTGVDGKTIGHGLGAAPELIITKGLSNATSWVVGIGGVSGMNVNDYLTITEYDKSTLSNFYQAYSTNTFQVGVSAANEMNKSASNEYISYCFRSISGISKIGTYTGNGSTTGPITTTGFEPQFLLVKRLDANARWVVWDNKRDLANIRTRGLNPEGNYAEITNYDVNFLSNGFQLKDSEAALNASGGTYLYMTFK